MDLRAFTIDKTDFGCVQVVGIHRGDHAFYEKLIVPGLAGNDGVENRRSPWLKHEKDDHLLHVLEQFVDGIHFLLVAGACKPDVNTRGPDGCALDMRIGCDKVMGSMVSGITEPTELLQEEVSCGRILNEDAVIDLSAQAGGTPVRAASPDRLGGFGAVTENHEFVMAEHARSQQAVMNIAACVLKSLARICVFVVGAAVVCSVGENDVGTIAKGS